MPSPDNICRELSEPQLAEAWRELVRPLGAQPAGGVQRSFGSPVGKAPHEGARGRRTAAPFEQASLDIEALGLVEEFGDVSLVRGWDHALDRPVMIRALSAAAAACPRRSSQFWTGARFQARLKHARLIGVHALDEGRNWVVTESARHSLTQELRKGPLTGVRVRRVLDQALEGLAYLHEQGQLHGQIQPDALLVDDQGDLKIDRPLGVQNDGEFLFRPGLEKYTAPETLDESRFGRVGPQADLYSLGMTVLELLAGDRLSELVLPDDAKFTDAATAWQKWHVSAAASMPPVLELLPRTPPGLAKVLDKLLTKQVSDRFASAREAWASLNYVTRASDGPALNLLPVPTRPELDTPAALSRETPRSGPATSMMATTYGRPRIAPLEESRLNTWAEKLTDEKTSNTAAVAVLLIAVFAAGLMFFSGGQTEIATLEPLPPVAVAVGSHDGVPEPPVDYPVDPVPPPEPEDEPDVVELTPTPPTTGRLAIHAPASAVVLIDRVEAPSASVLTRELLAGEHLVEVRQWNCLPWEQQIKVKPGALQQLIVRLKPRAEPATYEPLPTDGLPVSSLTVKYIAQMLDENWDNVGIAKFRYPKVMANLKSRNPAILESDFLVVHAIALWEDRLQNNKRSYAAFAHAARIAPTWYSMPRKHLIRERMLAGNYEFVYEDCELLARATQETPTGAISAKLAHEFQVDSGRFLGAVGALLEGPCKQLVGLEGARQHLSSDARMAYDETFDLVTQHYDHCLRSTSKSSIEQALIREHLRDTIVAQRHMLLKRIQTKTKIVYVDSRGK